jgi:hypothetical protein
MNIVYLIATFKHSRGGHYYSLKSIAGAISRHEKCIVINIGLKENKILRSDLFTTYFIRFNGFNYVSAVLKILRLLGNFKPSVIHSFDNNTLAIGRIISRLFKIPLIYTKCGGPNPKRLFSFVKYMIVFQKENENYIRSLPHSRSLNLFLIPNRIDMINSDPSRIADLKKLIDNRIVFLRIARIGKDHERSLIQSVNLIKKLHNDGFPVQLLVIGYIEDQQIFNNIREKGEDTCVTFLNDDYYTYNANCLVDIADFVIGTGRGLMEAASKSKILLSSIMDAEFPALLTPDVFEELFYYNFSNRSRIQNYSEEHNYNLIKDLVADSQKADNLKQFSSDIFHKHFSVQTAIPTYLNLYTQAKYESRMHLFGFLRSIFHASKVCLYWKAQQEAEN